MITDATLEVFRTSLRAHASDMPLNDAEKNALQMAFDHHTATLRQQAARVDEGMMAALREIAALRWQSAATNGCAHDAVSIATAALAAIAQNTQGEALPEWAKHVGNDGGYYAHAESARVPDWFGDTVKECIRDLRKHAKQIHDLPLLQQDLRRLANRIERKLAAATTTTQPEDAE